MGMSCSSVCVDVCLRIVRTGQILAKIKNVKNDVFRFGRLHSGCGIASVVLRYLDQLFKVKYFKCQYLENGEIWQKKMLKYEVLYRFILAIEMDHFECSTL